MSIKVIGAGFGRTGTLSLKMALEQLGFDKCYHMLEVRENPSHVPVWADAHAGRPVDWDALFAGYQASVDWPSCNLWREQLAHFPDAKVLLSLRDPDSWYDSIMNTIYPSSSSLVDAEEPELRQFGQWAMDIIWNPIFDNRMDDRSYVIDRFNQHNQTVIDEVPPEKLLVFEAKHGWKPLCEFLNVPVPATDYPRVNTTEDFNSNRGLPGNSNSSADSGR